MPEVPPVMHTAIKGYTLAADFLANRLSKYKDEEEIRAYDPD